MTLYKENKVRSHQAFNKALNSQNIKRHSFSSGLKKLMVKPSHLVFPSDGSWKQSPSTTVRSWRHLVDELCSGWWERSQWSHCTEVPGTGLSSTKNAPRLRNLLLSLDTEEEEGKVCKMPFCASWTAVGQSCPEFQGKQFKRRRCV